MEKSFLLPEFNYKVITGKLAEQANGAVWFQQGGTVVLATVVSSPSKEFPGFLPLSVDYRELFSAAGKIPGGYLKREGKFSDKEVLTSRLIDRAIRPIFPARFFDQVQVLVTVFSVDKEHTPYTISLIASSLALTISSIPFLRPVGAIEAVKDNGKWILEPSYDQIKNAKNKITIAGTSEGICMVEGRSDEITEEEFVELLFEAHEKIKLQVKWQQEIQKEVGKEKEPLGQELDWEAWEKRANDFITESKLESIELADKTERKKAISELKKSFIENYKVKAEEAGVSQTFIDYVFENILKKKVTERTFQTNKRLDGRAFDQIRSISTEVGLLPCNHGSALFNRGSTQALVSVTLGSNQDEQRVDTLMDDTIEKSFMLHYNFPPFSVGEVKPMRGPSRREIGHGHLAASALKSVLPSEDSFPYTIRIVSDILSSNGSSSMATVCGSTMALMDAGVPIKSMVGGIAMGLLISESGDTIILSDITGTEDGFGLMDFKVAGTDKGITAVQMDIKYKKGIPKEVFAKALNQAKEGRKHILSKMSQTLSAPKPELSKLVPQVVSLKIPTDKIGAIIGSGGKIIKEIIEKTDTSIDIGDNGVVKIYGQPGPKLDQAIKWVNTLAGLIEKGTIYQGEVKRVSDFGIFVEIAPGLDGLVHISSLPKNLQSNLSKEFKLGQKVKVQVIDYDKSNGRIRLKLVD